MLVPVVDAVVEVVAAVVLVAVFGSMTDVLLVEPDAWACAAVLAVAI